jgi:hypothetical protein
MVGIVWHKKGPHNNLGCSIKNFISKKFWLYKREKKNVNILHECKESRDVDCLLRVSIEYNIDENNKNATLNH